MMVFNDRYRVKVATRNINVPGIQNFRDLGGYKVAQGKSVRWGMIYRSAGNRQSREVLLQGVAKHRCENNHRPENRTGKRRIVFSEKQLQRD